MDDAPDHDPTMGPCIVCGRPGEDFSAHHTSCECDLENCVKVICDDCRHASDHWVWVGENTREVHIDCYRRMTRTNARIPMTREDLDGVCADHPMVLNQRCHFNGEQRVSYHDGVLSIRCAVCEAMVVEVAVVRRSDA